MCSANTATERPSSAELVGVKTCRQSTCGTDTLRTENCILRPLNKHCCMADNNSSHVVVLGAGFGGLAFCEHFRHPKARVTIVDRTNHHLFQPLLYQVAAAGLAAPDIAQPIRSILSNHPNLTVLMDQVMDINLTKREVSLERTTLGYDYLVLALGSCTSYFGHPEWEEFAPGLKTINDALRIRSEVLLAFEKAENSQDL